MGLGRARIVIDKWSLSVVGASVAILRLGHNMCGGKALTKDTRTIVVMVAQRRGSHDGSCNITERMVMWWWLMWHR